MDYPQGTQDLYDFLGTHKHEGAANEHSLNMPNESEPAHPASDDRAPQSVDHLDPVLNSNQPLMQHDKPSNTFVVKFSRFTPGKIFKNSWPYVVIFLVALFFYMAIFTNFSLVSFLKNAPKQLQTNVVQAQKPKYANLDIYDKWIRSYFYEVNDPALIDPSNDISRNGLTNYQKFVLGLNPKKKDTMGLGISDTEALMQGINPLTGSKLTDEQKTLIASYIDLNVVSNKLALNASNNASKVAGASAISDEQARNSVEINQNIPGQVDIPALNVSVPLIWTQDVKNFDQDLKAGVVHYPGTALPGEIGTAYVSGHSSNYSWAQGAYNKIFDTLGNLKQYDSFTITATTTSGKTVIFHYVVSKSQVYKADDQAQFQSENKSIVALSTCWPIGTSAKRLVVFGELTQTDK